MITSRAGRRLGLEPSVGWDGFRPKRHHCVRIAAVTGGGLFRPALDHCGRFILARGHPHIAAKRQRASRYSVSPHRCAHKAGPKPMENRGAYTPTAFAARKCPNSCTKMTSQIPVPAPGTAGASPSTSDSHGAACHWDTGALRTCARPAASAASSAARSWAGKHPTTRSARTR